MIHVVGLSGGKDSVCLALALREKNPDRDYVYFYTPTGDELPEMVAHMAKIETLLGQPIIKATNAGRTLDDWIKHFEMIPNGRARWCTRLLKIETCKAFLLSLTSPVLYIGLRADEPERKGGIYDGIPCVYPLRDWGWGLREVWGFLKERGIAIPARTDCATCFFQRIGEWYDLWHDHPDIYAKAEEHERRVTAERGRQATYRRNNRDSWPTALADLRAEFERGSRPRGAGQTGLFENTDQCRVCRL
jgi:3'-phosphoadenosine 5'-phosphosulfate sulfotransferase (PAPS reductase)/FAD synthetase